MKIRQSRKLLYRKEYESNHIGRDFVVADIHGCYTAFKNILIKELNFDFKKDRVFSLGDIIDKGAENLECLTLLDEPWFFPILGNHEALHLAKFFKYSSDNGTKWAKDIGFKSDYFNGKHINSFYESQLIKLSNLPLTIHYKDNKNGLDLGFIHAEYKKPLFKQNADERCDIELLSEEVLWSRDYFDKKKAPQVEDCDMLLCGHSIVKTVKKIGNHYFMDTGFYEGDLKRRKDINSLTQTKKEKIEIKKSLFENESYMYENYVSPLTFYDIGNKEFLTFHYHFHKNMVVGVSKKQVD